MRPEELQGTDGQALIGTCSTVALPLVRQGVIGGFQEAALAGSGVCLKRITLAVGMA